MGFFAGLLSLVIVGFGVLVLLVGVWRLPNVFNLLGYDSYTVGELRSSGGPVKIQGRAVAASDRTATAPLSGSSCLLYTYEVEQHRSTDNLWDYETRDEGMDGVDIIVDDGTGRALVDPTGTDVTLASHTEKVKPGEKLPDRLAKYVARTPNLEPQKGSPLRYLVPWAGGNTQRFTEGTLGAGDDVYVYGQARQGGETGRGHYAVDAVVGDGDGAPMFVISDTGTLGTAWRLSRGALSLIVIGAGFIIFGIITGFIGLLV